MEKQQIARPKPANYRKNLQERIPKFYNPFIFFTLTNLIAFAAIYYSAKLIRNPSLVEWLTIPAIFLFANFVEYLFHKGPMHNRIRLIDIVFKRHTLMHHHYFPHSDMGFDSHKDAYLVLFPFWMIFLVFALVSPIFAVIWILTSQNIAGFFLIVAIGYFLLYEWLHLSYHLPERHPISKSALIRALRRHHQDHHNASMMNDYNFNITFPIWDWVFGTLHRREEKARSSVFPARHP